MSTQLAKLSNKFAPRFEMDENSVLSTLKQTAFKGDVSDAQMAALLIVADQYKLNPFTREIYAFPDKQNGIVPVVGVDGWARIINEHSQFDGIEFEQDNQQCTCIIYRKDRSHPIKVTEYLLECKRDNTIPWATHPRRMLRHRALIQCARLAFGFTGIYDQDDAERLAETAGVTVMSRKEQPAIAEPAIYSETDFDKNFPAWRNLIESGKKTPEQIIAMVETKAKLTPEQRDTIEGVTNPTTDNWSE